MAYEFLNDNPLFAEMSPEKREFLMRFANSRKPSGMQEMMPFLLSAMNSARREQIRFSPSEADLLIGLLKQNMSPEEAKKADKILQLINNHG